MKKPKPTANQKRQWALDSKRLGEAAAARTLDSYGYSHPHHLIQINEPPASLLELRRLLSLEENQDLRDYAIEGGDFSQVMARLGTILGIGLDGYYDGAELCGVFVNAIHGRMKGLQPHLSDVRLVQAEIIEKEDGSISLESVDERVPSTTGKQRTEN